MKPLLERLKTDFEAGSQRYPHLHVYGIFVAKTWWGVDKPGCLRSVELFSDVILKQSGLKWVAPDGRELFGAGPDRLRGSFDDEVFFTLYPNYDTDYGSSRGDQATWDIPGDLSQEFRLALRTVDEHDDIPHHWLDLQWHRRKRTLSQIGGMMFLMEGSWLPTDIDEVDVTIGLDDTLQIEGFPSRNLSELELFDTRTLLDHAAIWIRRLSPNYMTAVARLITTMLGKEFEQQAEPFEGEEIPPATLYRPVTFIHDGGIVNDPNTGAFAPYRPAKFFNDTFDIRPATLRTMARRGQIHTKKIDGMPWYSVREAQLRLPQKMPSSMMPPDLLIRIT